MSRPISLGPLAQLADIKVNLPYREWHTFEMLSRGGEAGRWAYDHLQGDWTFERDFTTLTFYIRDAKDATLFKLTWVGING